MPILDKWKIHQNFYNFFKNKTFEKREKQTTQVEIKVKIILCWNSVEDSSKVVLA